MTAGGPGVSIFSLTERGAALAADIRQLLPDAEHIHRPKPFLDAARQAFTEGKRCIFICSTGIVVRALAPVLRDKHQDPAVLVVDEQGRFVIPLLSTHEGGAAEFGQYIADAISAQCVVTSTIDYRRPVYALGVGCARGCPAAELHSLAQRAMNLPGAPRAFAALASIDIKSDEAGLTELANSYSIPLKFYTAQQLREVEHQLSQKSEIVFQEVGCYGVAEAAALCAAAELTGQDAELVINKHKTERATVAVARSFQTAEEVS